MRRQKRKFEAETRTMSDEMPSDEEATVERVRATLRTSRIEPDPEILPRLKAVLAGRRHSPIGWLQRVGETNMPAYQALAGMAAAAALFLILGLHWPAGEPSTSIVVKDREVAARPSSFARLDSAETLAKMALLDRTGRASSLDSVGVVQMEDPFDAPVRGSEI